MADLVQNEVFDDDNEENEEEKEKLNGNFYEQMVLQASGKGDLENVKLAFEKKPACILTEEKKKWTPMIWASSKNHVEVFKFLVEKGALETYLKVDEVNHPNKCTLGVINQNIKPTPLQWACFQGNLQIVWILLKKGCRWEDVDQFGNNCVHLAASGSNLKVFEALLMHGVETTGKNSRNHSVMDLSTNQDIINLIEIHLEVTKCDKCALQFDDTTKKHWCSTCRQIYCPDCFKIQWTWQTAQSEEEERLDGKCLDCWDKICIHTQELQKKMDQYEHGPLNEKIEEIEQNNIEIDLKKFHEAKQLQEQLRTQNVILDYINSLKVIENYKTIFKSVHYLKERKEDATERGVKLDQNVIDKTDAEIERLLSERKLRFDLDNMQVGSCTPEDRKELGQSIDDAREKGVANNYLDEADDIKAKMEKSLDAKEIYKLFCEYGTLPEEDYPKCFYLDKKTQKVFDPETKKPADSKRFPPPKKKKKKKGDPKLVIPDWCMDSPEQLDEKIKTLKTLLESAEDCKFETEFISNCNDQIKRMLIEWKYRVAQVEENRLVAEWKLAQKKKK